MRKSRLYLAAILLVLVLTQLSSIVMAQATGRVTGSVVDATGAVIPGATVSLKLAGGKAAVFQTVTSASGLFGFTGIRPASYDLTVEQKGFTTAAIANIKVDALKESALPAVKLEVASAAQTVEVTGDIQAVQTTNAEVVSTINTTQVNNLPLLDRQINQVFYTQAGFTSGRGASVVNGMHSSMTNITLDGINVQDTFIRTNAADLVVNNFTTDQVAEVTIATTNAGAASGAGAEISLVGKSGTNQMHGAAKYYNRNNAYRANTWFNNQTGIQTPGLNLNQFIGSVGGPIKKDKLFYYGNYEAYRYKATSSVNHYVLTPDANKGIFSYRVGGATQKFDIMKAQGLGIDSYVKKTELDVMPTPNNNLIGDGLNYAGYMFNARNNDTRDTVYGKVDYIHSTKHTIAGTFNWVRDQQDRPDAGNFITQVPPIYLNSKNKLFSVSWRWNPTPTITNELRGGFNLSEVPFESRVTPPAFLWANSALLWQTNVNDFLRQGRKPTAGNLQDNAAWFKGKHNVTFGFQTQFNRLYIWNDGGTVTSYTSGISNSSPYGFGTGDIPGASSADLSIANTLLPNLAGLVDGYSKTFNVSSRSSGYVAGQTAGRHFSYDQYAGYVQDAWKIMPRLTLTLGMRYEYLAPLDERDGLFLLPVMNGGSYINAMMNPTATLDFAGGDSGRKFYKKDRNNFAPNLGFAYDLFGNGKTAIRGGFRQAYVIDDLLTALRNSVATNGGLSSAVTKTNLAGFLANPPAVTTPAYKVPLTSLDNWNTLGTANAVGGPNPDLVTPYVLQWNFGIQHSVKGILLEARYVGNHGTKLLRAIDYNQVMINQNGFLDDFKRAMSNGEKAFAATGSYNPAYNAAIAGSVPLTVIGQTRVNLANSTVRNYIRTGQAGTLASYAFTNLINGPVQMFTNTSALGNNGMENLSNSTYNALQLEARHTTRGGIYLQASYDYSKVLTDTLGGNNNQFHFDPYLDNATKSAERSRAPFDLNHNIKFNYVVPLPLGKGKLVDLGKANRLVQGWSLGGIFNWQSGYPFSILSSRGTVNRGPAGRSLWNTANTTLTKEQLDANAGLFMTGNGPYFMNPGVINTDGRATTVEGSTTFSKQIFTQPGAGTLGALQRRFFSGPSAVSLDTQISKDTKITERFSVMFTADFFNVMNHPTFQTGNEETSSTRFTIDNTSFGKITSGFYDTRVIQFGLQLKF